jgi:hypothetical protein
MAKQHTTTLKSKAYSMGKLANVIWGEDYWDAEYLRKIQPKCHLGN